MTTSIKLGSLTAASEIIDKNSFNKNISPIETRLVEITDGKQEQIIDIASSFTWESGSYNSQLVKSSGGSFVCAEADISQYTGKQIKFYAYGICGFRMADGTVSSVADRKASYNKSSHQPNVLDIPEGAKDFCITTGYAEASFTRTDQTIYQSFVPSVIDAKINTQIQNRGLDAIGDDVTKLKGFNDKFGFIDYKYLKSNIESLVVGGAMNKVRYDRNFGNETTSYITQYDVNDEFLKSIGITGIAGIKTKIDAGSTLQYSFINYPNFDPIVDIVHNNRDKRFIVQMYVYSKHKQFPTNVQMYTNGLLLNATLKKTEDTSSEYVKKYTLGAATNTMTETKLQYLYFIAKGENASESYEPGEFGITGLTIGTFASAEEETTKVLVPDWVSEKYPIPVTSTHVDSIEFANDVDARIRNGETGLYFNHVEDAKKMNALFFEMFKNKYVNKQNRLVVSFNGDSIIGSQLDDIEESSGYATGDFPPNMSRQIMAKKFFDKYRFADEDVKFRNLKHADWTKVGLDVDRSSESFNRIETFSGALNDNAVISVSSSKYIKFVWSEMRVNPYKFKIWKSEDAGQTYAIFSEISVDSTRRLVQAYMIKEIDPSKSYMFKIELTENAEDARIWGIETWTNPRLDVIVEAYSGSTAYSNSTQLIEGYYSAMHKPSLVIMDILALNDGGYDISDWNKYLTTIYDHCKKNGVGLIAIGTHTVAGYIYPVIGPKTAQQNNVFAIDMTTKINDPKYAPTGSIKRYEDGLHLNNYGNRYYFEELERIFDSI